MRHVVIEEPGQVHVTEAPDPELPGADGAVIDVTASAICGSDLHFYEGEIPFAPGMALGHEFIGRVAEVGTEVRRFSVGDRVLVASVAGCGHCDGCATGDPVTCVHGPQVFGSGVLPGGQASAVAVHSADFQLLAIPDDVTDDAALLMTDNLNTGWAAAKRADIPPGGTVLVLGLGAVGQCAVRAALALGAGTVLAADPVAGRRKLAADSGATPLTGTTVEGAMEATNGRGVDAVIDAVALNSSLDDAFACVRAAGTISVVGVHDLSPYPLPILLGLFRSLTLRLTTAPVHQTWKELMPMVRSGRLPTGGIMTHEFPLAAAAEGYALAAARSPDCLKIMLRP
ncbi:MAG TPA: alcohol dehydrogenase catalytic domain-containing protein [Mycobacteriales bacterium]|nr:alcohol dehydrogenase catalytic domain-containing protein [Mycobacteriales bacterium]